MNMPVVSGTGVVGRVITREPMVIPGHAPD